MPTEKRRIAMLTSGGDAPGLNAVIRAAVKMGESLGYEMLGIEDGFEGLLATPRYRILTDVDVRDLLSRGGTILRSTNRGHFNGPRVVGAIDDPYLEAYTNIMQMGLAGLITIGGEGTQTIAMELSNMGAPVIGVPKTIDNDISYIQRSFGFETAFSKAVHGAACRLDRLALRYFGWSRCYFGPRNPL